MPNRQVLVIEPQNELKFRVDCSGMLDPFTAYLRLSNPTNKTVLFKIKTTAPKKYCVRPNAGVLDPHDKIDIAITPQPVFVDSNEKHKHKFMVQSIVVEADYEFDQVWKDTTPDQLMDYKLKCVFETPRGANDAGDTAAANDATKKRVPAAEEPKAASKEAVEGLNSEAKRNDDQNAAHSSFLKLATLKAEKDKEIQKVVAEMKHMREEESKLIHENLRLKEDLLRLRQSSEFRTARSHSFGPDKAAGQLSLVPWLATAIGMALLGIIIGKFFM